MKGGLTLHLRLVKYYPHLPPCPQEMSLSGYLFVFPPRRSPYTPKHGDLLSLNLVFFSPTLLITGEWRLGHEPKPKWPGHNWAQAQAGGDDGRISRPSQGEPNGNTTFTICLGSRNYLGDFGQNDCGAAVGRQCVCPRE